MKRALIGMAAVIGLAVLGYKKVGEPWWRRWGLRPGDNERPLPGDDLIPSGVSETRGITIRGEPQAIWPWLVQMGYGRAGWYSYDQLDMDSASAASIRPDQQQLAVGDVMPTHPEGGFLVKHLEPNRALVLSTDTAIVREQAGAAQGRMTGSANIRATGALMATMQPPDFAGSWAFVLEPAGPGMTRLTERWRVWFGASDRPWTRFSLPLMQFGIFVMVRKQLLGIRDRVEHAPAADVSPVLTPEAAIV